MCVRMSFDFKNSSERFEFITFRVWAKRFTTDIITAAAHVYLHVFLFLLHFICHFDRLHRHLDYQCLFLLLILKWRFIAMCGVCMLKCNRKWSCVRKSFSIKVTQDLYHQFNVYICLNITFLSLYPNKWNKKKRVCHTWNFPIISKIYSC